MEVDFEDDDLDRLETDPRFTNRLSSDLVRAFRKVMQYIRAASDERDFYEMKALHFEKLEGREGERSMRLNNQYRLVVRLEGEAPNKRVVIVEIDDYH